MKKLCCFLLSLCFSNMLFASTQSVSCVGFVDQNTTIEVKVTGYNLEEHDFISNDEEFEHTVTVTTNHTVKNVAYNALQIVKSDPVHATASEQIRCGIPLYTENFNLSVIYKQKAIDLECTVISEDRANKDFSDCE